MKTRVLATSLLLIVWGLSPDSAIGQPREITEGVHYRAVDTPQEDPGGEDFIVVNELFWYGCPRCASLSPLTSYWRDGVRGDLRFTRTPVIWNDSMRQHARIFFTAKKLALGDRFHEDVYNQLHDQENSLMTGKAISTLFAQHGVTAADFQAAWDSAEVDDSLGSAARLSNELVPEKIPALYIDGRYVVTRNAAVPDHHEMIIITNLLIRQLRDSRQPDGG